VRCEFELADVLKKHWPDVEKNAQNNGWQLRTLGAIKRCRTAQMGGHIDACTDCGILRISYDSCRNRHCPKCQGNQREQWIQKREEELLPVPYFHVVFTLPDSLNQMAMQHPKSVYDALFDSAWATVKVFGQDSKHLGATPGMISILHTWGQTLTLHPHLHCIVPGGGITKAGYWKKAKSEGKYLFPVKAMSKVFRAKYVASLKTKETDLDKRLLDGLFKKDWVVFAKRPFGNAQSVIEYLGRYTHKIAISNHRIKGISENGITFSYKDYRKNGQKQEMTLDSIEFIRRFSMHILPKGFTRIRHFGILSGTSKKVSIPLIKSQIHIPVILIGKTYLTKIYNPLMCPHCGTETMKRIEIISKRGPPQKGEILEPFYEDKIN
jgi:hypothetical protein